MYALVLKHVPEEGPGTLGVFLRSRGVGIVTLDLFGGDPVPSLKGASAVVSMGGPMSANDEQTCPYLADEMELLRQAVREGVPVLGICLGAQLLAKAHGAKVTLAPVKEIGWSDVRLTPAGREDPLFQGMTETFDVFQWHGETFDIPDGGRLLAMSQVCPNQAFRVGASGYGLQFHVEMTAEMLREWSAGSEFAAPILERYEQVGTRFYRAARVLFINFLSRIIAGNPAREGLPKRRNGS
jgi:GMP synthase (glutamine-hydrolysing)